MIIGVDKTSPYIHIEFMSYFYVALLNLKQIVKIYFMLMDMKILN